MGDEQQMIQLFLIIENRMLREAMKAVLQKQRDFLVLDSIRYSPTAFKQAAASACDILVADRVSATEFPGNFVADLVSLTPGRRAILFGMDDDSETFLQSIRAGVSGYLLGDASAEEVVTAIRKVAVGEAVCPPRLCHGLFEFVARSTKEGPMVLNQRLCLRLGLTARQQQLMTLVARGLTNKEIAEHINLSEFTVKNHIHRIMRRLNAQSRYAAVQTVCESTFAGVISPA